MSRKKALNLNAGLAGFLYQGVSRLIFIHFYKQLALKILALDKKRNCDGFLKTQTVTTATKNKYTLEILLQHKYICQFDHLVFCSCIPIGCLAGLSCKVATW